MQQPTFSTSFLLRLEFTVFDGTTVYAGAPFSPGAGVKTTIAGAALGRIPVSAFSALGATFGLLFSARVDGDANAVVGVAVASGASIGQTSVVTPSLQPNGNVAFEGDQIYLFTGEDTVRAIELFVTPLTNSAAAEMVYSRYGDASGSDEGVIQWQTYTVAADGALAPPLAENTIIAFGAGVAAIDLPSMTGAPKRMYMQNNAGGAIIFTPPGGQTINGAATFSLANATGAVFVWNSLSSWTAA